MESAPKRRKTSPTTSLPVETRPETPSRIPVLKPQDPSKTSARRPSFASPTRASLARHNPQLLKRASSPSKSVERPVSRGKNLDNLFAKALGEVRPSIEGDGNSQKEIDQVGSVGDIRASGPGGRGLSAKPRRLSRSPVKSATIDHVQDLEGIANPFQKKGLRRSPVSSATQNTVVAVASEESNPFQRRGLRRSPVHSNASQPTIEERGPEASVDDAVRDERQAHNDNEGEDDPPTPLIEPPPLPQPIEPTNPPPIIDEMPEVLEKPQQPFDQRTPGQRSDPGSPALEPQQTEMDERLRPKSVLPAKKIVIPVEQEEPQLPPTPTQRGLADPIVTTPPTGIHNTPSKRERARRKAEKMKSSPLKPREEHPKESLVPATTTSEEVEKSTQVLKKKQPEKRRSARFLIPEDPHAEKKKERDALLKELQLLQADITLGNRETERLRLLHETSRKVQSQPLSKESEGLVSMLLRATTTPSRPQTQETSIFKTIHAFLPFRSRRKITPVVTPLSELEKPLPSMLPLEQKNPLPYLQAFTPLTYTSSMDLLPPTPTSQPDETPIQLGQQTITCSHPSSMFLSRLSLLVNTANHSIHSLEVLKLDPNAESELGAFVRKKAEGKELSVVTWAMGRWVEVALKRAAFWCAVESEFDSVEARTMSIQAQKESLKRIRTRDWSAQPGAQREDVGPEKTMEQKWTKKQLLAHMARTDFEITGQKDEEEEGGHVVLRLEWKLNFDWTGEVESSISAVARVPDGWKGRDDRDSLLKIPDTFQGLMKEKGPLGAVRGVVSLLFDE